MADEDLEQMVLPCACLWLFKCCSKSFAWKLNLPVEQKNYNTNKSHHMKLTSFKCEFDINNDSNLQLLK